MITITEAEAAALPEGQHRSWAYNCMDCCVTAGVVEALLPKLTPVTARTYAFERAVQAPAFAMMRRGVLVDKQARDGAIARVGRELRASAARTNKLPEVATIWDAFELNTGFCQKREAGKRHRWPKGEPDETRRCKDCNAARRKRAPFNPGSWQQVWRLLYTLHGVPKQKNKKREYSVDDEVLERIGRKWPKYRRITDGVREAKGLQKQLGFLKSRLSPSGRMHSSFNVGAAWTGRFSSSEAPTKVGTNLQNIAEKNRHIFIADPGMKLGYFDLKQAESLEVAYDAEDEAYIQAHLSGDVHTFVARMLWPNLPWTGVLADDKIVAGAPAEFDKDHSWRYNAKRSQHGLNYMLTPRGLAIIEHIPLKAAAMVYNAYFQMFPRVKARQMEIAEEVKRKGELTNALGRHCQFFGRMDDDHTIRQAVAFPPQSMVADILDAALWWVWHDLDPERIQLLAQVHDAILFQYPEGDEAVLDEVARRMEIPVKMRGGRTMTIPVDRATGWNWGKRSEKNPRGMA
jgi:DNA polymerase I-like protein with 3'-5' exonuclease and polymerase domains